MLAFKFQPPPSILSRSPAHSGPFAKMVATEWPFPKAGTYALCVRCKLCRHGIVRPIIPVKWNDTAADEASCLPSLPPSTHRPRALPNALQHTYAPGEGGCSLVFLCGGACVLDATASFFLGLVQG